MWQLKIYFAESKHKKTGVAIIISDKTDFKMIKNVTGDKKVTFILIKVPVHQESITIHMYI